MTAALSMPSSLSSILSRTLEWKVFAFTCENPEYSLYFETENSASIGIWGSSLNFLGVVVCSNFRLSDVRLLISLRSDVIPIVGYLDGSRTAVVELICSGSTELFLLLFLELPLF